MLEPFAYRNIATATTTLVSGVPGVLGRIVVGKPVASATIAIYDGLTAAGVLIGTITYPATLLDSAPVSVAYDIAFRTGLCIVTSGATDLTICYR